MFNLSHFSWTDKCVRYNNFIDVQCIFMQGRFFHYQSLIYFEGVYTERRREKYHETNQKRRKEVEQGTNLLYKG